MAKQQQMAKQDQDQEQQLAIDQMDAMEQQQQPIPAGSGGHGPLMAGYLLITGIMAPALLSQPFIFASLGWAAAIIINLVMAFASWYCMFHQAKLFHYGGGRHCTYKRMGDAILGPYMGRWGGLSIAGLQYFINVGTTITNMILAGQLLQSVYSNLCTNPTHCTLTSTSAWIGISGALSYCTYIALPDMSSLAWASICGTVFAVYFSVAGMVMSGLDGNHSTAVYSISGAPADQVFNGLNAVGMLLFLYGVTVLPEIQDVLRPDGKTGSTARPMIWAATAAHCVFVPLYLLVGIIGYWAYGSSVDPFLLFAHTKQTGLVVSAELAAAIQIQLVSQVLMLPVFEACERLMLDSFPRCRWLGTSSPPQQPVAPTRPASVILRVLSPATTADSATLSHMASLATHMVELTRTMSRSTSDAGHQRDSEHAGAVASPTCAAAGPAASSKKLQLLEVRCVTPDAAAHAGCVLAPGQKQPSACHVVDGDQLQAASSPPAASAAAEAPRHGASIALMLVNRTVITGLLLFVACALPFFSSIMGFFGAVGFGPITYALPTILYTVAYQNSMPRAKWWFNLAFITFWLLASLAAAVGALYSIVTTASTYHFFS